MSIFKIKLYLLKSLIIYIIILITFINCFSIKTYANQNDDIKGHILIYSTGNYSDYDITKDNIDGDIVIILESYNYSISVTDRKETPVISETLLSYYDEFWFLSGDSQSEELLNRNEIDAILDFIEDGNGLYIMGDDTDSSHNYSDDANQIAKLFGVTFYGRLYRGESTVFHPNFENCILFDEVNILFATPSEAYMDTASPVNIVATYEGNNIIAILDDYDHGRIVFDTSHTRVMDGYLYGDTPQLMKNIADWLINNTNIKSLTDDDNTDVKNTMDINTIYVILAEIFLILVIISFFIFFKLKNK